MPRKPKHIEEKVDNLIQKGYTSKEIKNEVIVSDSYISTRRKKIRDEKARKEESKPALIPFELSKKSVRLLYNLQGMLDADTLDDLIQIMWNDYKPIMVEKYKYDIDNKMTVAQVFSTFKENHEHLARLKAEKMLIEDLNYWETQELILTKLGLGDVIKHYNTGFGATFKGSLFEFLVYYTMKYRTENLGSSFSQFDNIKPLLFDV